MIQDIVESAAKTFQYICMQYAKHYLKLRAVV
jgi:hypothetical protein